MADNVFGSASFFTRQRQSSASTAASTASYKLKVSFPDSSHPFNSLNSDTEYAKDMTRGVKSNSASSQGAVKRHANGNGVHTHANGNGNGHVKPIGNGRGHTKQQSLLERLRSTDWEIPRKTLHSSIGLSLFSIPSLLMFFWPGFFTLYLYTSNGNSRNVIIALSSALAIIVPADLLRLNYPPFEALYERLLGFLMRESEKVGCFMLGSQSDSNFFQKSSNGVIWYILGTNTVLSLFPLDIATVSILMYVPSFLFAFVDSLTAFLGRIPLLLLLVVSSAH